MKKATSHILSPDESSEYFLEEGCYILECSNSEADPALSIARARLPVGKSTRWHFLKNTAERYYILQGIGRVEIGNLKPQILKTDDIAVIAAGEAQRIHNIGEEDLIFLCFCTPRFELECYVDGKPTF